MFGFWETDLFLVLWLLIVNAFLSLVTVKWMDDLFILLCCGF